MPGFVRVWQKNFSSVYFLAPAGKCKTHQVNVGVLKGETCLVAVRATPVAVTIPRQEPGRYTRGV